MNNFLPKNIPSTLLSALTLFAVFFLLVIPNRLSWIGINSFVVIPLEMVVLGFVLLLDGRIGLWLRWLASLLIATGTIFKIADMATYKVFARPFNPVFDAYLLSNGMNLLTGALGKVGAALVAILLLAVVLLVIALAFMMLGRVRELVSAKPILSAALLLVLTAIWLGLWWVKSPRASTQFYDQLAMHVNNTRHSIRDMKDFEQILLANKGTTIPQEGLFQTLKGKDVVIIFIESYGRTLLDKPEFAAHIRPLMQSHSEKLRAAGFSVRSAYLTSPTVGGLSWLAHGTAMSGLWVNSQVRYDTLVMSKWPSLNRLFQRAGWRSVGVMPAITMAWPEGNYFGYDKIYHAHNSGYEGKPFNWVTMPDQFTLAAFQRNELEAKSRDPVMAEIALISSHAPWTPVPELVNWDDIGNGEIFNEQAARGDSPEEVWQDVGRIRLQFRLSIEYTLNTLVDYLLQYGNENLVVMAFGDHQPAPLVTGDSDNRDVPVHFFTRDPSVLGAISGWGWAEGMIPADGGPVWGMEQVRGRFIETFSAPSP